MTELQYPRDDARFRDGNYGTGIDVVGDPDDPPVRDVPDEAVDFFKSRGWEEPDSDDQDAADSAAGDGDQDDGDSESQSEDQGFGNAAEGFDADAFVDRNVDPIADDIGSGDYDNVLDEILEAEQADGSPRTTVTEAIEERRGA